MRQEPVLLRLVETVNFIDEEQCAAPVLAAQLGRVKDLAQFRHPGENRADLLEMQVGFIRQQPCDRRLAHPRRPPEDQRTQRPRGQHDRQRRIRAKDLQLPDHLRQGFGAQTVSQGPAPLPRLRCLGCKKVRHRRYTLNCRTTRRSPRSTVMA